MLFYACLNALLCTVLLGRGQLLSPKVCSTASGYEYASLLFSLGSNMVTKLTFIDVYQWDEGLRASWDTSCASSPTRYE